VLPGYVQNCNGIVTYTSFDTVLKTTQYFGATNMNMNASSGSEPWVSNIFVAKGDTGNCGSFRGRTWENTVSCVPYGVNYRGISVAYTRFASVCRGPNYTTWLGRGLQTRGLN